MILELLNNNLFLKSLVVGFFSSISLTILGIFIVLKRTIFITLAISEVALLGLVVGVVIGINPYISMGFLTASVLLFFSFFKPEKNLSEDILVALVYAVSFSLSILILSKTSLLESHLLNSLSGNILLITNFEIILSSICCILSILFFVFFNKQLFFIYSDKDTSLAYAMNYKFLNFLFFVVLGVNIVSFLKSIGMILSFSYLFIPCSFALTKAKNIGQLVFRSILVSLIATMSGVVFSFLLDLPTAPTIVVFLFIYNVVLKIL